MKYRIIENLNHNNIPLEIGSIIELSDNEALPLLSVKTIEPYFEIDKVKETKHKKNEVKEISSEPEGK